MNDRRTIPFAIARFHDVAAEELLGKSCGMTFKVALIFTPDDCLFARVDHGNFLFAEPRDQAATLSRAYEIRAFGDKAELRWIREGMTGIATLLAEEPLTSDAGVEIEGDTTLDVLDRRYLVWGKVAPREENSPPAWSKVASGRIGPRWIPFVPQQPEAELVLHAREYVIAGAGGNAVVLFERLVGFAASEEAR
jgi:CRISPR-associated protein (TIGR03984 family)